MEDEKRIFSEALDSMSLKKLMGQDVIMSSKNNSLSDIFRKKANELFKPNDTHDEKTHRKILFYYCKSVATAVNGSDQLAFAYGDRSKMLMHMGLYLSSAADINRALEIKKDDLHQVKLLLRRTRCFIALHIKSEVETTFEKALSILDKLGNENMKRKFTHDVRNVREEMDCRPEAIPPIRNIKEEEINKFNKEHGIDNFSAVGMRYGDKKYGRYLCATKDFQPGEVLFIEKPYIRCTDSFHCHMYCSHCFNMTLTAIHCDHCSWIMFCSDDCKTSAWNEYHKIECAVYSFIKENSTDTHRLLVLRAFILGLKEFGSIENLQKELKEFDKNTDKTKGFMHDGEIHPHSSFTTIYSLCSDVVQSREVLQKHIDNAALILKALAVHTTYFGDKFNWSKTDSYKTNENAMFVGSLLIRLSKIIQINSHLMRNDTWQCKNDWDLHSCSEIGCCMFGRYLAPVSSLLNHSCDPNAIRCYSRAHDVIMFALKPIEKGEQIFECYTESFYKENFTERQKKLSKIFTFECSCEACREKWSDRSGLLSTTTMPSPDGEVNEQFANVTVSDTRMEYDEESILGLRAAIQHALGKQAYNLSTISLDLFVKLQEKFYENYGLTMFLPPGLCVIKNVEK